MPADVNLLLRSPLRRNTESGVQSIVYGAPGPSAVRGREAGVTDTVGVIAGVPRPSPFVLGSPDAFQSVRQNAALGPTGGSLPDPGPAFALEYLPDGRWNAPGFLVRPPRGAVISCWSDDERDAVQAELDARYNGELKPLNVAVFVGVQDSGDETAVVSSPYLLGLPVQTVFGGGSTTYDLQFQTLADLRREAWPSANTVGGDVFVAASDLYAPGGITSITSPTPRIGYTAYLKLDVDSPAYTPPLAPGLEVTELFQFNTPYTGPPTGNTVSAAWVLTDKVAADAVQLLAFAANCRSYRFAFYSRTDIPVPFDYDGDPADIAPLVLPAVPGATNAEYASPADFATAVVNDMIAFFA